MWLCCGCRDRVWLQCVFLEPACPAFACVFLHVRVLLLRSLVLKGLNLKVCYGVRVEAHASVQTLSLYEVAVVLF